MAKPMSPQKPERRPRLVLHARALRDVEAGLAVSIDVAVALRMELSACFIVEDASLEASRLPFTTHIGFSGRDLALDPARLERLMRREAQTCRRMIVEAAQSADVVWSFESLRGDAAAQREASAEADDILVVRLDGFGSPPPDVIAAARARPSDKGGVLFVPPGRAQRNGPVVALGQSAEEIASVAGMTASLANLLGVRAAHAMLADGRDGPQAVPLLRAARLLVAPLRSALLDDEPALRRLVARLGAPLLALHDPAAEGRQAQS